MLNLHVLNDFFLCPFFSADSGNTGGKLIQLLPGFYVSNKAKCYSPVAAICLFDFKKIGSGGGELKSGSKHFLFKKNHT